MVLSMYGLEQLKYLIWKEAMSLLDKLRELGISENLIKEIEKFRSQYPVDKEYESRIPVPT